MASYITTLWHHTLLHYGNTHYYVMATYITTLWQHTLLHYGNMHYYFIATRDRRGRDRMVVGFITTYAISPHHHYHCELESLSVEV
jgi:hypothetical protein